MEQDVRGGAASTRGRESGLLGGPLGGAPSGRPPDVPTVRPRRRGHYTQFVSQTYVDTGKTFVDQTPRGRASPNYILDDARKLKPQHLARIESFIAVTNA